MDPYLLYGYFEYVNEKKGQIGNETFRKCCFRNVYFSGGYFNWIKNNDPHINTNTIHPLISSDFSTVGFCRSRV